jgi:hypothetical protein
VRIAGCKDVFIVVGTRADDLHEVQLGNDGASKRFEKGANLELVAKAGGRASGSAMSAGIVDGDVTLVSSVQPVANLDCVLQSVIER